MSHTNQYSIRPIAAAVSAALATPAATLAQEEGSRDAIDEIIVSARKRDENVQGIPSSVQAIPEAMLNDMGALSTEDYARFVPSLTWRKESGGGANQIIFRGINTGASDFIATSSASMYLDETSLTMMGDQPDIRLMDIARVEALPGPQGTLFGAAAQSGTLRIITNQPDPSQFEASVNATLRSGETSDESYDLTGVLNIPLVEDVFAIRIAAQTAEDGGFIDNVFGHTPDTWKGTTPPCCAGYGNEVYGFNQNTFLGPQRVEFGTLDNAAVVEKNWNSVEHFAYKVAARWDINDNWAVTLTYNHANNEAQAGNDYMPFVGDLQTIAFAKNLIDEEWDLGSLTIEADLGFAQFVSATSWFERNFAFSQDQTLYYKYWSTWACEDVGPADGYTETWRWDDVATGRSIYYPLYCPMGAARSGDITQQADYIGVVEGPSWQDKFAQEFRLSHQGETFDWLAGLYFEDSNDNWDAVWLKGVTADYQDTLSLRFAEFQYSDPTYCAANFSDPAAVGCGPGTTFPDAEYVFLSQDRTNWKNKAVFGELTWHINAEWHATIGGRWFETENTKSYLKFHAGHTLPSGRQQGGIFQPAFAPGTVGGTPVFGKLSEFVPKFSLSWNVSDDKMVYALYTEGFRTGGINRANSKADWSRTIFPQAWEPDLLKNSEIGVKTRWADGTVQFNLTYFHMAWDDFQIEVVDPSFGECIDPTQTPPNCSGPGISTLPWLKVVGNAGDALSRGVQAELAWIPAEGWDIGANAQWLEAEIDAELIINRDKKTGVPTVVLPKGQPLPNIPEFQGSAWVSYSWPVQFIQGGEMVLRGQYSYTGESENLLIPSPEAPDNPNPSFINDSYAIGDVRLGLISHEGGWQLDLFVYNISDERAQIFNNVGDKEWVWGRTGEYEHGQDIFTNRPREYGLRFSKRWGD